MAKERAKKNTRRASNRIDETFADVERRVGFIRDHKFEPSTDDTGHPDDGCVALGGDDCADVCPGERREHLHVKD